mgnify:CR=1 FL=1
MKATQYSRIAAFLARHKLATYHDLMLHCGCNWPHKRLAEMEARGYQFWRGSSGTPAHTVVRMTERP